VGGCGSLLFTRSSFSFGHQNAPYTSAHDASENCGCASLVMQTQPHRKRVCARYHDDLGTCLFVFQTVPREGMGLNGFLGARPPPS